MLTQQIIPRRHIKHTMLLLSVIFISSMTRCDRDDVRTFDQALKDYLERPSIHAAHNVVEAFDTLKAKPENQHATSTSYAKASWKGHPIDFLREMVELKKERDQLQAMVQGELDKHTTEYTNLKAQHDKLATELKNEQEINIGLSQRLEVLSQKVCIALDEKKFTNLSYDTQTMYSTLASKATPSYLAKIDKEQLHKDLSPALQTIALNESFITDVACAFDPVNKLNRQTTRLENLVHRIEKRHTKLQKGARRTKELAQELEQERETRKSLEEKLEKQTEEKALAKAAGNRKKQAKVELENKIMEEELKESPKSEDVNPLHQDPEQTPSVETDSNTEE